MDERTIAFAARHGQPQLPARPVFAYRGEEMKMTQTEWLNQIHVRLLAMFGVYRRPVNVADYLDDYAMRRAR